MFLNQDGKASVTKEENDFLPHTGGWPNDQSAHTGPGPGRLFACWRSGPVNRFDYHQTFWFPQAPDELWRTLERYDDFESWWPWLRTFAADRPGMTTGNVLHGIVVPPVPYRLRLDVTLAECRKPELIRASVSGDVTGCAELRLTPIDGGSAVVADWSLEMTAPALRIATRVAYPLMLWGHNRVVDMAVSGFRRRALPVAVA
jgi:hypothetical protein